MRRLCCVAWAMQTRGHHHPNCTCVQLPAADIIIGAPAAGVWGGACAQAFAAKYLTAPGRACYWYRAVAGLASVQAYTPVLADWPHAQPLREAMNASIYNATKPALLLKAPWAP